MRIALLAVSMLALAGCGSQEPAVNVTANSAEAAKPVRPPSPKLGKVDLDQPLRAFGTEPFWTLDVAPGDMSFTDYSVETPKPEPYFPRSPVVTADKAVWTTKNEAGAAVVLTLTLKDCLEAGEADQTQPFTAELKIGDRTRTGCAGPKPEGEPDEEVDNASAE
ncbi:MAG: hypothetical protein V4574_20390 [Pseudomonadota bacterium]